MFCLVYIKLHTLSMGLNFYYIQMGIDRVAKSCCRSDCVYEEYLLLFYYLGAMLFRD